MLLLRDDEKRKYSAVTPRLPTRFHRDFSFVYRPFPPASGMPCGGLPNFHIFTAVMSQNKQAQPVPAAPPAGKQPPAGPGKPKGPGLFSVLKPYRGLVILLVMAGPFLSDPIRGQCPPFSGRCPLYLELVDAVH